MIQKNLLIFIILLTSVWLVGCDLTAISNIYDTAHIKGVVVDATTQTKLNGVTIITDPPSSTATSDNNGNFFIFNIQMSNATQDVNVIASKDGYLTTSIKVTLHSDDTVQVYIPLLQN